MDGQISFKFEVFEGPLDLLLHLIEKNKIDICDIPIAELLEQYMEYIEEYRKADLDTISDFIAMASTLLYIKSKMLLPPEEEEEDPREPLVDMLSEYKRYKEAAASLQTIAEDGNNLFVRQPESISFDRTYTLNHPSEELKAAYAGLYRRIKGKLPPPVESFSAYVSTKIVSVNSRVTYVLRHLLKRGKMVFSSLFIGARSRSEIVATFLAVLELSKVNRIHLEEREDSELEISLISGKKANT